MSGWVTRVGGPIAPQKIPRVGLFYGQAQSLLPASFPYMASHDRQLKQDAHYYYGAMCIGDHYEAISLTLVRCALHKIRRNRVFVLYAVLKLLDRSLTVNARSECYKV